MSKREVHSKKIHKQKIIKVMKQPIKESKTFNDGSAILSGIKFNPAQFKVVSNTVLGALFIGIFIGWLIFG